VTVNFLEGQAPTLEMRFSTLDMDIPSPNVLSENANFYYPSGASGLSPRSGPEDATSPSLQNPPQAMLRHALARSRSTVEIGSTKRHRYKRSNSYVPGMRAMSTDSTTSDSLEVVHKLAAQFPGLPPRVTGKFRESVRSDYNWEHEYSDHSVSRETSTKTYRSGSSLANMISRKDSLAKRKPEPMLVTGADAASRATSRNHSTRAEAGHEVSYYLQGDDTAVSSPYTQVSSSFGFGSRQESFAETPATEGHNPFIGDDVTPPSSKSQTFASSEYGDGSGESIRSAQWIATASRAQRAMAVDIDAYRSGAGPVPKTLSQTPPEAPTTPDSSEENRVTSTALSMPWLPDANDVQAQREEWSRNDLARIKSVGNAPRRTTPTPTHVGFSGVSVLLEKAEADALMTRVEKESTKESNALGYAV